MLYSRGEAQRGCKAIDRRVRRQWIELRERNLYLRSYSSTLVAKESLKTRLFSLVVDKLKHEGLELDAGIRGGDWG